MSDFGSFSCFHGTNISFRPFQYVEPSNLYFVNFVACVPSLSGKKFKFRVMHVLTRFLMHRLLNHVFDWGLSVYVRKLTFLSVRPFRRSAKNETPAEVGIRNSSEKLDASIKYSSIFFRSNQNSDNETQDRSCFMTSPGGFTVLLIVTCSLLLVFSTSSCLGRQQQIPGDPFDDDDVSPQQPQVV